MWQHVQVMGVKAVAVQDKFKGTAVAEMKHAEKIAERLWYLGGTPTTKPSPIEVGKSLKSSSNWTHRRRWKPSRCIKITDGKQGRGRHDGVIFKEILEDEEEHHDLFTIC
jgi:bacterioferritin